MPCVAASAFQASQASQHSSVGIWAADPENVTVSTGTWGSTGTDKLLGPPGALEALGNIQGVPRWLDWPPF